MGRHPAAVGLLADGAAPARLPDRPPGDARRRSRASTRFTVVRGRPLLARGLPVAGVGHGAGDDRAARRRRARADDPALVRAADWLLDEEVRVPRRLDGAPPAARARRLGLRVRERQLPRHRRHRRGGARAAPRRASGPRARGRRRARAGSTGCSACRARTAAGAPSTPTTPARSSPSCPFCDFGEVTDPPSADVTAHVRRDARRTRASADDAGRAARPRLAAARAGGRRLVVRPLGREPRLRHRRPRCRRSTRRASRGDHARAPRGALARARTRTPTAAGARTAAPTWTRPGSAAGTSTASQTAWALIALHAAGQRDATAVERGLRLARRDPARRRHLGRAASSPAPASPATSTSTTTSTGSSSR